MTIRFLIAVDGYAAGDVVSTLAPSRETYYTSRGWATVGYEDYVFRDPVTGALVSGDGSGVGAVPFGLRQTLIVFGDSKTAQGGGVSIATPVQPISGAYESKAWFTHLNYSLGHPFDMIGNAGIGGQKTEAMLARFASDVVARRPNWVAIMAGTNDLAVDGTTANILAMWDMALAAGIRVLAAAIPPIASGDAAYVEKNLHHMRVNWELRRAAASRPGVVWIDVDQATLDPSTTFQPLTGMLTDALHESSLGAAAEGYYAASKLRALGLPVSPLLGNVNGDPTNMLSNPMLYGTAANTPANWTKVNMSTTVSYVARDNAAPWCQLEVANGAAAAGLTSNVTAGSGLWSIGDTIQGALEMECDTLDPAAAANSQGARLTVQFYNGSSFFSTCSDIAWQPSASYGNFKIAPWGVFETPRIVIPATTTTVQIYLALYGGGKYRVSRAAIRNLTRLGIV